MGEFIFSIPLGGESKDLISLEYLLTWLPIVLTLAALLVCIIGYRFFITAGFLSFSVFCGYLGAHFLKPLCESRVSIGIVFAIFTGVGGWLIYIIVALWNGIVKKFHCRKLAVFMITYGVQIIGAALLAFCLYKFIYTGLVIDIVASVLISLIGYFIQKKGGIIDREARLYEDEHQL